MERNIELTCGDGDSGAGERLDVWLAGKLEGCTRSHIQKLISDGRAFVNGGKAAKNYRVKTGDVIFLERPRPEPDGVAGQDIKLNVVYEDDHIIAVDKPRGMVVHPGAGNRDGTLANALAFHCGGALSGAGGPARPGIVHRLDKDTSGLIVAAKTDAAHHILAAGFRERKVRKVYNAIVRGSVGENAGRIEMPIGRHRTDRQRMAVRADGGRAAVTLFKVILRMPCGCTWLELDIPTGRTHQIRVHLAQIGFPVAGDPVYGRGNQPVICPGKAACGLSFPFSDGLCPLLGPAAGQMLHSTVLEFDHPANGERLILKSALPAYFPNLP